MDAIKSFFARDIVKTIVALVALIVPAVASVLPEQTKTTVLWVWGSILTPVLIAFGALSGGTSGLRSDESKAVTATLQSKGVVPPAA